MTCFRKRLLEYDNDDIEISIFTNDDGKIVSACLDNGDSVILDADIYTIRRTAMRMAFPTTLLTTLVDIANKCAKLSVKDGNLINSETGEVLLNTDEYEICAIA